MNTEEVKNLNVEVAASNRLVIVQGNIEQEIFKAPRITYERTVIVKTDYNQVVKNGEAKIIEEKFGVLPVKGTTITIPFYTMPIAKEIEDETEDTEGGEIIK